MSLHHSREEALREIRSMPEQCFVDGLLLDVPKRRRREQAMNKRPMLIKLPPDQKLRLGKQLNRFIELCTKDLGIEIMLKLLEQVKDEQLKAWAGGNTVEEQADDDFMMGRGETVGDA